MAGNNLPPELPRGKFLGQSWTERNYDIYLHGLLIRYPLGGFRLEAGLFDSISGYASNYSDLLTGVKTDGFAANRIIVASAELKTSQSQAKPALSALGPMAAWRIG
jgi:hypothetical protein